jgi:hypothetical protein
MLCVLLLLPPLLLLGWGCWATTVAATTEGSLILMQL